MFERIAYVSRAAREVGPREVFDIVRTAHNRNSSLGLTGGLLYVDGCFAQVLEGEGFRVRERLEAIACDPRHTRLELRLHESDSVRLFDGDWMALRLPAQIPDELRDAHAYAVGFPASTFDGPRLLAFVRACCQRESQARAGAI